MVIVTKDALRSFILAYWGKLHGLVSQVRQSYPTIDLKLVFPQFMIEPFYVRGVISRRHGVAIEFVKPASEIIIEVIETDKEVEEVVLPRLSDGDEPLFRMEGSFTEIGDVNIISEDFYRRHKDLINALTRAANIIAGSKLGCEIRCSSC